MTAHCPFCESAHDDNGALVDHLLEDHAWKIPRCSRGAKEIRCWCGVMFTSENAGYRRKSTGAPSEAQGAFYFGVWTAGQQFAAHLDLEDGLAAHLTLLGFAKSQDTKAHDALRRECYARWEAKRKGLHRKRIVSAAPRLAGASMSDTPRVYVTSQAPTLLEGDA